MQPNVKTRVIYRIGKMLISFEVIKPTKNELFTSKKNTAITCL